MKLNFLTFLAIALGFQSKAAAVPDTFEESDSKLGVEWIIKKIRSTARKNIGICMKPSIASPLGIGCSKFGGKPDVPEGFQWPCDDKSRPLSLLLQINCSDLKASDKEKLFPSTGFLYFFYELEEENWDGTENSFRVVYYDVKQHDLHRVDFPENLYEGYRLKEIPVSFPEQKSYPTYFDIDEMMPEELQMSKELDEAYERVKNERDANTIATMSGYADIIQNPIVEDTDKYVLLLQIFSDESGKKTEIEFGDCGNIFFYISREDLKAKRFDRIKFELQCY